MSKKGLDLETQRAFEQIGGWPFVILWIIITVILTALVVVKVFPFLIPFV